MRIANLARLRVERARDGALKVYAERLAHQVEIDERDAKFTRWVHAYQPVRPDAGTAGDAEKPAAGWRLTAATIEAARALAPGHDIAALEMKFRDWNATKGTTLANPDKAFLAWLPKIIKRT